MVDERKKESKKWKTTKTSWDDVDKIQVILVLMWKITMVKVEWRRLFRVTNKSVALSYYIDAKHSTKNRTKCVGGGHAKSLA